MEYQQELGETSTRRACDQCRLRKVRCDRQTPCANCVVAKQHCSFTGQGRGTREPRHRILITPQYEKKIDHLESRLERIESVLQTISVSQQRVETASCGGATAARTVFQADTPSSERSATSNVIRNLEPSTMSDKEVTPSFEGSSSLVAHAAFAGDFVENAAQQPALREARPELHDALCMLRRMLQPTSSREMRFGRAQILGKDALHDLPMPPLQPVLTLLRELKHEIPQSFSLFSALTSVDYFTERCRMIYFATENFSQATFIIANAGLYYIFQEKIALGLSASCAERVLEFHKYHEICQCNLETALANINLLIPACKENVQALLMGASYAIDISKPSLAWPLNAAACHLCLSLGYHRQERTPGEDEDQQGRRSVLFWAVYIFDKALSLRLGRPSVLQDYDITLSRTLQPIKEFGHHIDNIQTWLVHAEVQGKMYEDLFSPRAMKRDLEQRIVDAHACAQILLREGDNLYQRRKQFEAEHGDNPRNTAQIYALLLRSDEVALLSSLTLVYRTIPPEESSDVAVERSTVFGHDCIFIARKAMDMHLACMDLSGTNQMLASMHAHWSITFTPFIPFIVLFCFVLESSDVEDLERLDSFMTSLEPCKHLSEHIDSLFKLCQVLHEIARLCVETVHSHSAGTSIASDHTAVEAPHLPFPSPGDWFSGYVSLFGLSEFNLAVIP
ncbi:hypothetical protein K491DRAFT_662381 [Lophiostoma macrostomum CBS 122681]|uniref:Zn(2)-C6 fungal-type domain-containing protein n=1 Tax=Lophiostoma macrostomum CBS 122681 TaxID=1314788 RepID=A0A6A6T324_9PLEO|nr:hypothetical protein K491DRAFT_662381 [Lophiostoma macrostomum CBS 122681]